MLMALAGAAEMERNPTRGRTFSTMAGKRVNGQRIGSVPYGSTLLRNESEQAVIAGIRTWRTAGWTLESIAAALADRSVPTKTGKCAAWNHRP